jgi:hypothetical protein
MSRRFLGLNTAIDEIREREGKQEVNWKPKLSGAQIDADELAIGAFSRCRALMA